MTITAASADALEALALAIFNPEITPSTNPALGKPKSDAFREALLRSPANKYARARKHCDKSARFKNVRLKKPKA